MYVCICLKALLHSNVKSLLSSVGRLLTGALTHKYLSSNDRQGWHGVQCIHMYVYLKSAPA